MAMRLDKYLAQAGMGTRSEVKKMIRFGRVFLNGVAAGKPEEKVFEDSEVVVDGNVILWSEYEYFMLNKPAGAVSATQDSVDKTVVDLITCPHSKDLFPVGRLDKDTEGLLLLTNDGALAHELLSPRKHVEKTYFVRVAGCVSEQDKAVLENGMDIGDEKPTKPAKLQNISYFCGDRLIQQAGAQALSVEMIEKDSQLSSVLAQTCLEITITEGRYHQIKRMFEKVGKPVQYLKRLSMGSLVLDDSLAVGEFRELTKEEVEKLRGEHAYGKENS